MYHLKPHLWFFFKCCDWFGVISTYLAQLDDKTVRHSHQKYVKAVWSTGCPETLFIEWHRACISFLCIYWDFLVAYIIS